MQDATTRFLRGRLQLQWRQTLTERIQGDYFQNMTYYKMCHVHQVVTNPEQRIASDIPKFCTELSELLVECINVRPSSAIQALGIRLSGSLLG